MLAASDVVALHQAHVLTPWIAQRGHATPIIDRGEGRHLVDRDGKRYFDLASGLVATNLGHGHPTVVAAMREQAGELCFAAPALFNTKRAELAAELSRLSPWAEGARAFFTTGGAEANDDVVRMARAITGRHKILAAYRSFHGSTGTAIALTGEDRRWGGEGGGASGIVRFFAPFPYRSPFFATSPEEEVDRAIAHLERVLLHEDPARVAAVLIEPVVGSNGVIVYPDGYLKRLRALTEAHGILLVFDEVMTAFGRLGAPFGSTRLGVAPDMLTFAKGVTSAYVPLGGVLLRESLARHFDDRALPCGHTYAGHAFAVATGLACMRAYAEERLFEAQRPLESWLADGVARLKERHAIVGDVRGVGSFFGVELVRDRETREPVVPWHSGGLGAMKTLYADLRARGVIAAGRYNFLLVAPPLTSTEEEIAAAFSALDEALASFAKALG